MALYKLTVQDIVGFKTDIIADIDKCIESMMNVTSNLDADENVKIIQRTRNYYYQTINLYKKEPSSDSDQEFIASDEANSDLFTSSDSDGEKLFRNRFYTNNNGAINRQLFGLDDAEEVLNSLDNMDSSTDPRNYDDLPNFDLSQKENNLEDLLPKNIFALCDLDSDIMISTDLINYDDPRL
jgi:hypothetical protein